uniref:Vomeronasal type-1 receptor n=1 Tax=Catagonus wagneri TaxID=51154 RepID=A0A8C3VZZ1_9CETA
MATMDLAIGVIFLLQTTAGLLGNCSLVYHFLFLYFSGGRSRSIDLILKHVTLANLLVLLSRGIPETLAAFGSKPFIDDFGCKLVFYIHRVSRDVSTGTTCILSVFQVIMISPSDSRWAELKGKAPRYIGTSNVFCWILNMMLNILVPLYTTGKLNNTIMTKNIDNGYCYSIVNDKIRETVYVPLLLFHDGFCLLLMVWSSGSMVLILHRHKRQVRYIHSNGQSPKPSPETTATQSILVLVCLFVSSWTLSTIFHTCVTVFNNPSFWLKNTSTLIAACFPAISPYILMRHDTRESRFCFA